MKAVQTMIFAFNIKGTGRCFVGSHDDVLSIKHIMIGQLNRGTHPSSRLQAAWSKEGAAAFQFVFIEECKHRLAVVRLAHWVEELTPEFN